MMTAADVPGKGTLGREVEKILDMVIMTGVAGDLPGIYGGMSSVGWHHGAWWNGNSSVHQWQHTR